MKLSDLKNNSMGGVLGKVKSLIDNFTGPGNTEAAEEALKNETNPEKSKVLEVQLCLSKLQDIQIMQANLHNELKQLLDGVLKSMAATEAAQAQVAAAAAAREAAITTTAQVTQPQTATVASPQPAQVAEVPPPAPQAAPTTVETPTVETQTNTEDKPAQNQ